MFIAIPSFALLYSMDEVVVDPAITIKAIGHQWYWTYEYSDYNSSDEQSLTFDSYMIPEEDLELGQSRLLEVDNRVVVPAKTHLRIIVTSADVPHSWAVPSSGVKCDAVPGRLNQISILVQREGVYYGQCSEICGTNHAFTRAPGNIGRLLSPLWLSRTTRGCEPPEKQAITASGWSCREPRSKAVDKIEEGARHPVEQRGRLLLAFSLPRGALATRLKGEGRRRLTYGFKAWREAKGLDFTYDQISGQPLLTFFVVLLTLLKANFEVGLAFLRWEQLTLWWRRCREDLGV
ncbi:unnamed protein product [Eruca vesicaria subsp. sativa]|uniref:cytochrome-c oxidase n=1 Tax=Eruca vesicaria subsp. sativa TaxID=29727 RepID=A0ABC8J1T9_ERUVS|nr:unnamed protein product [Eruca vesicaria subsp. sativa]